MTFHLEGEPAHVFKLCLIGNSGAGKLSIVRRICFNIFDADTKLTIGVDFYTYDMPIIIKNQRTFIRFSIWNFGEQFRHIFNYYIHGANGIFLVFSLEDLNTALVELDWWVEWLQKHVPEDIPKMLVGCKLDLIKDKRELNHAIMTYVLKKYKNMPYYATSSKDNLNIRKIFEEMAKVILDKNELDYDKIL